VGKAFVNISWANRELFAVFLRFVCESKIIKTPINYKNSYQFNKIILHADLLQSIDNSPVQIRCRNFLNLTGRMTKPIGLSAGIIKIPPTLGWLGCHNKPAIPTSH